MLALKCIFGHDVTDYFNINIAMLADVVLLLQQLFCLKKKVHRIVEAPFVLLLSK